MKIKFLVFLLAVVVSAFPQADPPRVSGTPVVKTNNGTHFVVSSGSSAARSAQDRFDEVKNVLDYGLVPDGTTVNDTAFHTMLGTIGTNVNIVFPNPKGTNVYLFDTVTFSNRVGDITGIGNPEIKHKGTSSGHMWKFAAPQSGTISGFTFNGNIANQTTNEWHAMLYTYGDGQTITRNTFNGYVMAAILDFQTREHLVIEHNRIFNGFQVPVTLGIQNCAINFTPGLADTYPWLTVTHNIITNATKDANLRLPGGVLVMGSAESGTGWVFPYITDNFFEYVGDDDVIGAFHHGIAVLDLYQNWKSARIARNVSTNGYYYHGKFQNGMDLNLNGDVGHSSGAGVFVVTPAERERVEPGWGYSLNDFKAYGGGSTIGLYVYAGEYGGFRDISISGYTATNIDRGMQIDGFIADGTLDGHGPVLIENANINATNYGLLVKGLEGKLTIRDSSIIAGTTALAMSDTNNTATVRLRDNYFGGGTGWGVRVWAVQELMASGNIITSASGESVELQDGFDGKNIEKLFWGGDNVILNGAVDVTAADVDWGYFGNAGVVTWYPTGFTETTSGAGGSTYFKELRQDTTDASLLLRLRNDNTNGGALLNFRIGGTVVGSIGAFGDAYSDATRAGYLTFSAENTAESQGLLFRAVNSGQDIGFAAGDTTYRFKIDAGGARFPELTANRVLVLDAVKNVAISTADTNDLHYISTLTSDVQTQINNRQPLDGDLTTIANNNPGNSYYFGTDSGGTKGFYTFPSSVTITNYAAFAMSDLTTTLTSGGNKAFWRPPYAIRIVSIKASVLTASSSGAITIDVEEGGTTLFSTPLTIDESENSSATAAAAAVLSDTDIAADALMTFDIDGEGTNAAGLQVTFAYIRI